MFTKAPSRRRRSASRSRSIISTFQLKTERDSKFPSRGWIHNSPVNLYASEGLDQKEPWANHQYELQWEAMTDWPPASPTIEISNTNNRGYGGPGIYAQSGLEFATHSSIPLAPALSLAQLRHAPLNTGGQLPLVSQIVANSFAPPVLDPAVIRSEERDRPCWTIPSTRTPPCSTNTSSPASPNPAGRSTARPPSRTPSAVCLKKAPRSRIRASFPTAESRRIAEISDALTAPDGYLKTAAHLLIDSPLNVNSTRVDVWEAILNSTFGSQVPQIQGWQPDFRHRR